MPRHICTGDRGLWLLVDADCGGASGRHLADRDRDWAATVRVPPGIDPVVLTAVLRAVRAAVIAVAAGVRVVVATKHGKGHDWKTRASVLMLELPVLPICSLATMALRLICNKYLMNGGELSYRHLDTPPQ